MDAISLKTVKGLRFIHLLLSILLAVVTLAAYLMGAAEIKSSGNSYVHLNYIIPLVFIAILYGAYRYSKSKLANITQLPELGQKLEAYRKLQIVHYGLVELACLIALVSFVLTRELNYVIYASFMVIYLIYIRPNNFRIKKDLALQDEELG